MALYDQHLHTWHSFDCEADPRQNVLAAIERGLDGLTFTDHYDTHPSEWPLCRYDYDALAEVVATLRGEFGDRIFIGHGIEVCYQPPQMEWVLPFLESHRFDLVLLSVHWVRDRAVHIPEHWPGTTPERMTRAYLETVLEAVRFVGDLARGGQRPFDVLGHLDLVKRYTQWFHGRYDIRASAGLVDDILAGCIEADLVPEVNLSSLRQSLTEPMPADWVVRRYAELGGRIMSLGSDAHASDHVGAGFPEAADMLRREGIRSLAVFKNRERYDEPL